VGLFRFRGRLRRPLFALLHVAGSAVFGSLAVLGVLIALGPCPQSSAPPPPWTMALITVGLATALWMRTSLEVRRLHDMGWSGWWSAAVLLLQLALLALGDATAPELANDDAGALPSLLLQASTALPIGWFLLLAFAPPEPGPNRHGERPDSPWSLRVPRSVGSH
jgi:uncharacterized membrane protein YhaH (DUF805 family)